MQFQIQREAFLKPLQQVIGVIERRHTLPVLANFLVQAEGGQISLTGTDLEVEMVATAEAEIAGDGRVTIPARKLFDIVRALPDGSLITVKLDAERALLHSGRSRFTLSTLPADEFPRVENLEVLNTVHLPESVLKSLMDHTAFAMANQDVRYYLNGLLLERDPDAIRCVATDGHRLAIAENKTADSGTSEPQQIIIPRKGVAELTGLFEGTDDDVELEFCRNHLRVTRGNVVFTSKLIEGKFPDYEAVIPIGADKWVNVKRDELRTTLQRVAILSNEKYRGVRLEIDDDLLRIVAHNPEQEEAVEEIPAETHADQLAVGFNVGYLLDALGALEGEEVRINLRDAQSSCLLQAAEGGLSRHVIMPLRL